MNIVIHGGNELKALLLADAAKSAVGLGAALFVEAESIMHDSKPLVPVDEGTLRASGHVEPPKITGTAVEIELGYGGAADQYAVVQHERLDYRHTSGQAKFLEQPALEHADRMGERLGASLRRWLER